jgi:hypothetical protein
LITSRLRAAPSLVATIRPMATGQRPTQTALVLDDYIARSTTSQAAELASRRSLSSSSEINSKTLMKRGAQGLGPGSRTKLEVLLLGSALGTQVKLRRLVRVRSILTAISRRIAMRSTKHGERALRSGAKTLLRSFRMSKLQNE